MCMTHKHTAAKRTLALSTMPSVCVPMREVDATAWFTHTVRCVIDCSGFIPANVALYLPYILHYNSGGKEERGEGLDRGSYETHVERVIKGVSE